MKCPACGAANLVSDCRDLPYTYKGQATLIPSCGDFCDTCDEGIFDLDETQRGMNLMLAFNNTVDAALRGHEE